MQTALVYPQPGNVAPPYVLGWVEQVADAEAFASAMANKFEVIFGAPVGGVIITAETSTNAPLGHAALVLLVTAATAAIIAEKRKIHT